MLRLVTGEDCGIYFINSDQQLEQKIQIEDTIQIQQRVQGDCSRQQLRI
jgi:hypothetical protein